jgi:hypothetical protein
MYDYYLGGTANTALDRATAERVKSVFPEVVETAWANRGFLQRAVKRMSQEWRIRQFIDLGAGLPTQRATHEVAAESVDDVRVVYVDNDPTVIARGTDLLADTPGAVVIQRDIRDVTGVLDHPDTRRLIDFSQPVGLLAVAVVQWISHQEDPWSVISGYLKPLAPNSYLAMSIPTKDHQAERLSRPIGDLYRGTSTPGFAHTKPEAERYFTGLEVVEPYPGAKPAVTYVGLWGAEDPVAADDDAARWVYAAVARKP